MQSLVPGDVPRSPSLDFSVTPMTPRPATQCTHERRPGTMVCLYCRAEERAVARSRQKRAAVRVLGAGGGLLLVAALLVAGSTALRGARGRTNASAASPADSASASSLSSVALAADVANPSPYVGTRDLVLPSGRTPLGNGVFAERQGDVVVVNFDTRGARTRRSDKFEKVVRATLPAVLGEAGSAALERVEPGSLIPSGQLLNAVEQGELRLPVGDGRVVRLTPMTRMGEDGPLVVTYQVVLAPAAPSPAS